MHRSRNVLVTTLFICVVMQFFITGGFAHEWMAPEEAAKQKNPIAAAPSSVAKGKELFLNNCAYCHGENARGMSAEEAGLDTDTPDLKKRLENHSDGDFFWKIYIVDFYEIQIFPDK